MDAWGDIRLKARQCHLQALASAGGDRRAQALIDAMLKLYDLELRYYDPGTAGGEGVLGFLERADGLVGRIGSV